VAGVLTAAAPPARAGEDDVATAQILFEEGRRLIAKHEYERACPKFSESQRLSPGIGTEFNLADCWEHTGRLASAWGAFQEVADLTHRRGELDREQAARARADALEPKLGRLAIEVPAGRRVADLEVRRDGEIVREALWGVAVPVDAGGHRIEARAPGRADWSTTVQTSNGQTASLSVPELVRAASPIPPPLPIPRATPPADTAPGPSAALGTGSGASAGADVSKAPDRTLPLVALGSALVLAGVGVVGVVEFNAYVTTFNNDQRCGTDLVPVGPCEGYRSTANTWQTVAVASFVASGVAATGGVALWLLASRPSKGAAVWPPPLACGAGVGSLACVGRF
jgi:hypothetical protein